MKISVAPPSLDRLILRRIRRSEPEHEPVRLPSIIRNEDNTHRRRSHTEYEEKSKNATERCIQHIQNFCIFKESLNKLKKKANLLNPQIINLLVSRQAELRPARGMRFYRSRVDTRTSQRAEPEQKPLKFRLESPLETPLKFPIQLKSKRYAEQTISEAIDCELQVSEASLEKVASLRMKPKGGIGLWSDKYRGW